MYFVCSIVQPQVFLSSNATSINEGEAVFINCTSDHPRLELLKLEESTQIITEGKTPIQETVYLTNSTKYKCIAKGDNITNSDSITIGELM